MRRAPVDSTSIASIGYAPLRRELEIEFRQSGEVYRYSEVSAEEYEEFMKAESKGAHLNQIFKAKEHPFEVVKKKPRGGDF
jgi:hypothetical protein